MSNFETLANINAVKFKDDVFMLARQMGSIVLPLVNVADSDKKPGERVVWNRMGELTANEVTERYQELEANTAPMSARSCVMKKYRVHVTIDEIDDYKYFFDIGGPAQMAMSAALAKQIDLNLIAALTGSADNKDGSSSTARDVTSNTVAASTAIEFSELLAVSKSFKDILFDSNSRINALIEGNAYQDIMAIDQVINTRYNNNQPLTKANVGSFLDIDFHYFKNMPLVSSGVQQVISFTKDALNVAMPKSISLSIDRIPQRGNAILLQADFIMGAVRMEEGKVVVMTHSV